MHVTIINRPTQTTLGGFWFGLSPSLNQSVRGWIISMLPQVTNIADREHYRAQLSERAMMSETADIYLKSTSGSGFVIYHRDGTWRIGCRGIPAVQMAAVKTEILDDLESFVAAHPAGTMFTELTPTACLQQLEIAIANCVAVGLVGVGPTVLDQHSVSRVLDDVDYVGSLLRKLLT